MEISYYKINPTGNKTLIVESEIPRKIQPEVAAKLMALDADAEQVGFIESIQGEKGELRLQMMGGEFCGNATISAAALVFSSHNPGVGERANITLEVSGALSPLCVEIDCKNGTTFSGTVSMPLPEEIFDCELKSGEKAFTFPIVRMPGICHAVVTGALNEKDAETAISAWCDELNSDAFGLMFYDDKSGTLKPLVYVKSTQSCVWESSCASGSCAVAAYKSTVSSESKELKFSQAGGVLKVKAVFENGALCDIKLTGEAEIEGKFSVCIDA